MPDTTKTRQTSDVPETKIRTVRVDERWEKAQAKARLRYETITDVVRRAVDAYNADPDAFDAACATIVSSHG